MDMIAGWGGFPRTFAELFSPYDPEAISRTVEVHQDLIPRGLGRSYGDSSLSAKVIELRYLNKFISFDQSNGILCCQAGVSFGEIQNLFIPRGWCLPVTPGTQFITVGGAISSDVHGKNHHQVGTFCKFLISIDVLLGNGEIVSTSIERNPELFRAVCGGMGLVGVIISASFRLMPISSSFINQTIIKSPNLEAILAAFQENQSAAYSVAWIDCLASGKQLGRSILMLGEHAQMGGFKYERNNLLRVPFNMPSGILNRFSVGVFNSIYYHKIKNEPFTKLVSFNNFFYPLDGVQSWNRIYGKSGFMQYQFVIPFEAGAYALKRIMKEISDSGKGSFLAVLKAFGSENSNYLSFPKPGFTLALDFNVAADVFKLLSKLDDIVMDCGGRIYLTKDARMSEVFFKKSYPNWEAFQNIRSKYHALGKFSSLQSKRLGLQ